MARYLNKLPPKKRATPVDLHVGARVRMKRQLLGLSQTELANSIGLTFQQVQKYEKGVNRIGASRMQQIAAKLQEPISYFYDGLPSAVSTPSRKRTSA
jgi:transcriptional regulator with XRE-family HTH domain